jgi:hypothetical protein
VRPDANNNITPPNCKRCTRVTELLYVVPKVNRRPSYHIFLCVRCGAMEWISQLDLWGKRDRISW